MTSERNNDTAVFATYTGSSNCRECHAAEFNLWTRSHHALAERAAASALDGPAFDPPRLIQHGTQTSEVRVAPVGLSPSTKGRGNAAAPPGNVSPSPQTTPSFLVITLGADGERRSFRVERVIGVDPLRQFLVATSGGRFQVTELAFDPARHDWFDVFGDEDRKPGEWGHWTGRGMTWNVMCAACHNTRVRKEYDAGADTYATAMAEPGIGCESCHGPMADHAAWQRQRVSAKPRSQDPTLHPFGRDQVFDTCGSCHARRAELTGDFVPGDRFLDHFSLVIPDETDLFYADGQVHAEDYEFTSFLGSRMFAAGVRCVDCHEPHSGKARAKDNALCLRCHQGQMPTAPKIDPTPHSHHAADKPGGRCVDCHMPQTVYMQRHARHDHGFTIPDPLLTQQSGVPNACNRCHTDRDAAWALAAVDKWYGPKMDRPTRVRALVIARARRGQAAAVDPLLRMLSEEKTGLWRAVALNFLKRWSTEPKVASAMVACASDANPLVRCMAARALEPLAQSNEPASHEPTLTRPPATLSHPMGEGRGEGVPGFSVPKDRTHLADAWHRLLDDPVRAVRVEAAWTLHAAVDTNSTAGTDLRRFLAANVDEPSGAMQMGVFDLDRGDNGSALALFRRAVSWDGASAPLRQALAVSLSLGGDPAGAARELEVACRLAPQAAEYRFKLGLAFNEIGKLREAVDALEQAVKLDPRFAQAWYNLGLGYSAMHQPDRALEALVRAESIDARSPQIPYARATVLARMGRVDEARAAAQRALELQPDFPPAASLLQMLPAGSNGGNGARQIP